MAKKKKVDPAIIRMISIITSLIVIILIIVVVSYYFKNKERITGANYAPYNESFCGPFSRLANVNDIELTYTPKLDFSGLVCEVTAKADIKDLEISFIFTDDNGVKHKKYTEKVGNIDEGHTYSYNIKILESNLVLDLFTSKDVEYEITSGTVSKFAYAK